MSHAMADSEKKIQPPMVTSPTLGLLSSLTTAGNGGAPSSPVPRQFTHAPYLSTNIIVATEDLNASEYENIKVSGKRHENDTPGSPTANLTASQSNTFSGSPTHNSTPGLLSGKKNVCRHFLNGNCNRGSSCRFYHPGSIHRVITPTHPRTPTQRSLTPLADLAQQQQQQQQMSAFAATSPVHSPLLGPSVGMLSVSGGSPTHSHSAPRPVIDNASASGNNSLYVSPLSSPSNSHGQRVPYGMAGGQMSANAAPPMLSSASNGPQVNVWLTTAGARKAASLRVIPSLQLPDCTVRASEGDDGNATGAVETSVLSAPHSPTTPGGYRMSVHRLGVRTGIVSSPTLRPSGSASVSSSNNTSVRQDTNETSVPLPTPAAVTRNNPYAYSPNSSGVQR